MKREDFVVGQKYTNEQYTKEGYLTYVGPAPSDPNRYGVFMNRSGNYLEASYDNPYFQKPKRKEVRYVHWFQNRFNNSIYTYTTMTRTLSPVYSEDKYLKVTQVEEEFEGCYVHWYFHLSNKKITKMLSDKSTPVLFDNHRYIKTTTVEEEINEKELKL